jgi:hypothetical protein
MSEPWTLPEGRLKASGVGIAADGSSGVFFFFFMILEPKVK